MRSSTVIDQAATGSCRSLLCSGLRSRSWHGGGLPMLVVMAVLAGRPDSAFAQYPGFSSDAESAWVSALMPLTRQAVAVVMPHLPIRAALQTGSVQVLGRGAGSAASGNRSDGGEDHSQTASNGFGVATNRIPRHGKSANYYFVRKLRIEFAAMELVERQTGMAFSRHDVPRYLDELRTELVKNARISKCASAKPSA